MNIEQAIEKMCRHCIYEPGTNDCKNAECDNRIYVEALREKAERGKGCTVCNGAETIRLRNWIYRKRLSSGLKLEIGMSAGDVIYCPMCGRKLDHEPQEAMKGERE